MERVLRRAVWRRCVRVVVWMRCSRLEEEEEGIGVLGLRGALGDELVGWWMDIWFALEYGVMRV